MLSGLLVYGACGRRMHPGYRSKSKPYYVCMRNKLEGSACRGLGATAVDRVVSEQVLRALEPAALDLSLKAMDDIQRVRERLRRHWEQRLERAGYEVQRAERQYRAVEPENRLVARTLERRWEDALRQQRDVREEMDRCLREQPTQLSVAERDRIRALADDVGRLWSAPETTPEDRKEIIRFLVERVVVQVRADTEWTEVEIAWRGGSTTRHRIARSVPRYESLAGYEKLMARIRQLRQAGTTIREIAAILNAEGFRTPRSGKGYTYTSVRQLLSRAGLTHGKTESE